MSRVNDTTARSSLVIGVCKDAIWEGFVSACSLRFLKNVEPVVVEGEGYKVSHGQSLF